MIAEYIAIEETEMPYLFEQLRVYRRAVDFADQVIVLTADRPKGLGFLTDQLKRAAMSIATNLAEGNGRQTAADRCRFFFISRGSAQECIPLIDVATRRGLISSDDSDSLRTQLDDIGRMINGLLKQPRERRDDGPSHR